MANALFTYPCPECYSEHAFHDPDCRLSGIDMPRIEKAYIDILSVMTIPPPEEHGHQWDKYALKQEMAADWDAIHKAVFDHLNDIGRIERVEESVTGDVWRHVPPEEFAEKVEVPSHPALQTIYEQGAVDSALDNSVFALVAYYEWVGFDWDHTRELVIDWLHESGTWDRGSFEEATPEEVVDGKKHVFEQGYGWKDKAQAAASVIDSSYGGR